MPVPLSCQQTSELVTDYVEGRMSGEERLRFETHIGLCRHCRAYLKQMKKTTELLGSMPAEPVSDEDMAALLERFEEWSS